MGETGWEESVGTRRLARALPVLLLVVVAGALLARPSPPPSSDLEVVRESERGEEEPAPTPTPERVATLHALNTASLETRVPPVEIPLEGRRLRSAVTTRGLQRLVIGLESPDTGVAELQVRDSATLRIVATLGAHPGPLRHLAISPDAEAVLWRTPHAGGRPAQLHRVEFARTRDRLTPEVGPPRRQSVALPIGTAIVYAVEPLRHGLAAVAAAGESRGDLRVLVYDFTEEIPRPLTDVTVEGILGGRRPALVWHLAWSLLHVPHTHDDGLTTVELQGGAVHVSPIGGDPRMGGSGVVERAAGLAPPEGGTVVVTGALRRRLGDSMRGPVQVLPLDPIVFGAFDGPAEMRQRGGPVPGLLLATAGDRAALASRWREGLAPGTRVQVMTVDPAGGLAVAGREIDLDGRLLDLELDASRPRLTAAMAVDGQTVVSRHSWQEDAAPLAERRFAAGATVHLSAVVVIESG